MNLTGEAVVLRRGDTLSYANAALRLPDELYTGFTDALPDAVPA